jgi:membrane-associated phospholipid phosphatase
VRLPLFLTAGNKFPVGAVMFFLAVALYLPVNHFPAFEPQLLPLSWADRAVPFLPNTVWIYISEWFFFIFVYSMARDLTNLNKYFYSFLALQVVSIAIFWVWPTTYPRGEYPLPDDLNALTWYAFNQLRTVDTPGNCCPSLHVSSVYLSSFIYLDEQRGKFPFFFIWATLIALSTLTTKQHYVMDLVTGLLLAILCYWFFHKYAEYRAVQPLTPQLNQ